MDKDYIFLENILNRLPKDESFDLTLYYYDYKQGNSKSGITIYFDGQRYLMALFVNNRTFEERYTNSLTTQTIFDFYHDTYEKIVSARLNINGKEIYTQVEP